MEKQKSAGAVVFRKENEKIIYLILHYEEGHFDFPKGHIEEGETEIETLIRETEEETGIKDLKLIHGFKESINYYFKFDNQLINKDVVFYLAETKTKKVILSNEHVGFFWFELDKAIEKLTHDNAKKILKKADEFLKTYKK